MKKRLRLLFGVVLSMLIVMNTTFPSMAAEKEEETGRAILVIESYEVEGDAVLPGNEFEITLTIKNTNSDLDAKDVVLSAVNNQGIAFPVDGASNQTYVGDIEAGAASQVVVPMRVSENATSQEIVVVQFYLTYSDEFSIDITKESYITIPLKQNCSASIVRLSLSDYCYVGKNSILSSEIINDGTVAAKDVNLHITLADGKEFVYSIGDMDGGLTKYFDHTISMSQAGEQVITAYLTYTDEAGNSLGSEKTDYQIRVLEGSQTKSDLQNGSLSGTNNQTIMVSVILVVVALVIIFVFHKRDTRRINSGKEVGDGKRS